MTILKYIKILIIHFIGNNTFFLIILYISYALASDSAKFTVEIK